MGRNVIALPSELQTEQSAFTARSSTHGWIVLSGAFEKSDYEHIAQPAARMAINARCECIMDCSLCRECIPMLVTFLIKRTRLYHFNLNGMVIKKKTAQTLELQDLIFQEWILKLVRAAGQIQVGYLLHESPLILRLVSPCNNTGTNNIILLFNWFCTAFAKNMSSKSCRTCYMSKWWCSKCHWNKK